ncbi:hypothetical protein VPH35_041399 [Triticum aestivum]|uniref:uncharacterized protein n=1 Tax=Triticum aestivum TaxID=4565 RepID=UPI0008456F3D|nr:uncharacterized protein LOC123050739 [Triticum aestivum]
MGSWLSSPDAGVEADAAAVGFRSRARRAKQRRDANHARLYTLFALGHYNSRNKDAMFEPAAEPVEEPKAACIGFRQDFWYHVGFWASRRDAAADGEQQYFFAELRLERRTRRLVVETCALLEKPRCRFKSSCAFCPDKFQIFHPSCAEFTCGKKRHKRKFFREREMLGRAFMLRHAQQDKTFR